MARSCFSRCFLYRESTTSALRSLNIYVYRCLIGNIIENWDYLILDILLYIYNWGLGSPHIRGGGRLRDIAVSRCITDHYHPCSNPGVGISEGCFVFHFVSLHLEVARPI